MNPNLGYDGSGKPLRDVDEKGESTGVNLGMGVSGAQYHGKKSGATAYWDHIEKVSETVRKGAKQRSQSSRHHVCGDRRNSNRARAKILRRRGR